MALSDAGLLAEVTSETALGPLVETIVVPLTATELVAIPSEVD